MLEVSAVVVRSIGVVRNIDGSRSSSVSNGSTKIDYSSQNLGQKWFIYILIM